MNGLIWNVVQPIIQAVLGAYALALWLRDQSGCRVGYVGFCVRGVWTNSELGILPCGLHFGVAEATTKIA